jgi:tetratricopeptide (TPR) repeat protein
VREKWLEDVYYSKKYLEDIMELDPQSFSRYQDDLALCHAFLGNREMAENLMAERTLSTLSDSMENELDLATIYLVLGDNDAALNHLAKAAEIGKPFMIEREIDLYYLWDPLRGDPRFEALLAE